MTKEEYAALPNAVMGLSEKFDALNTDPGHTHTMTTPAHGHGITDSGHSHTITTKAINVMNPYYMLCA